MIEDLEQRGYLTRQSYTGAGLFIYDLTEDGRAAAENSSVDLVTADGMTVTQTAHDILEILENEQDLLTKDISDRLGEDSSDIAPHIQVLKRHNLVDLGGVFRATYRLSGNASVALG
jgi:Mn-dependent DtxR family transcriptional regulator